MKSRLIYFLACLACMQNIFSAVKMQSTENITMSPAQAKMLSDETMLKDMPGYWMRIINILTKGLDVCNLVGNDKISFVMDMNAVLKSPINDRTSLEKVRFLRVVKRAKTHDGFKDNTKAQDDFDKIEKYVNDLVAIPDYFKAIAELLAEENITERRGNEIMSYLSHLAYIDDLSDADINTLRKLIYVAIDAMPEHKEPLENLLKLLDRKPQIITQEPEIIEKVKVIEKDPEVITKVIEKPVYIEKEPEVRVVERIKVVEKPVYIEREKEPEESEVRYEIRDTTRNAGARGRRSGEITIRNRGDTASPSRNVSSQDYRDRSSSRNEPRQRGDAAFNRRDEMREEMGRAR